MLERKGEKKKGATPSTHNNSTHKMVQCIENITLPGKLVTVIDVTVSEQGNC